MFSAICIAISFLAPVRAIESCPEPTGLGSRNTGGQVTGKFINNAGYDIIVSWVDFQGNARPLAVIGTGYDYSSGSYSGHLFRFEALQSGHFLDEFRIEGMEGGVVPFSVEACGTEEQDALNKHLDFDRAEEFQSLVHDQRAPCVGTSSQWSCVRYLSSKEVSERTSENFGFIEGENSYRGVGTTEDNSYVRHIPNMPVYNRPGYLKMNFTQTMKDLLLEWYQERKLDSMEDHGVVGGGYMNDKAVSMDKINLDKFPDQHQGIIREMQQIGQWWSGIRLRHTSTFGIRVYRRGSMLINHVDRSSTHIISSVLQIGQEVDEDGGWPLEVVLPNNAGVAEVYLQPGEMVLYEGGRLKHGRPMRLKGTEFANAFTHFAPLDWNGPGRSRRPVPPRSKDEL